LHGGRRTGRATRFCYDDRRADGDHRLTTTQYRDMVAVGLPEDGHLGRGAALASVFVVFLATEVLSVERFGRSGSRPDPSTAT